MLQIYTFQAWHLPPTWFLPVSHWVFLGGKLRTFGVITHSNSFITLYIVSFGYQCVMFAIPIYARFTPEALNWQFVKGMVGWFSQAMLLKVSMVSLGGREAPLLDMVAYAGYTFTGMCLAVLGRITLRYACYLIILWTCLCMGIFLVKTMKQTLLAEVRSYDTGKHHYLLLCIALTQFPMIFWLSNTSGNWLF